LAPDKISHATSEDHLSALLLARRLAIQLSTISAFQPSQLATHLAI